MGRLGYYSKLSFQAPEEVIPKKIFAQGPGYQGLSLVAAENIMADGGFDSSSSSSTASDTRMSTDNVPVDNRDVSYCRYMFYSTFF